MGAEALAGQALTLRARLVAQRGFRAALVGLALLVSLAVYAPFLASDRPYRLEGVRVGEYERARKSLAPVASGLAALLEGGEAGWRAGRGARADAPSFERAVAEERLALETRLATLRAHLAPGAGREALDAFTGPLLGVGVRTAPEEARRVAEEARALRDALEPARVTLVPVTSWPLFAALTPLDLGLAVGWPLVLLALALRRPARGLALACVAGVAAGLLATTRAPTGGFATSNLKVELTRGEIELHAVTFAPVPYGFAEQHPEESLRPPTWLAASELDERGAYVRGPRAPRADPVTGFVPGTRAVEVRTGEPPLNAPARHWLGTDSTGRDLLARLIHGSRASLAVGVLATALLALIGFSLGALAGYRGGWVDLVVSRVIEVVVSFPLLFLVLVAVSFVGPSVWNVILAIGCAGWTGVARLARSEFLRARELAYVEAARSLGYSASRIVLVHVLPNVLPPLLVALSFSVAGAILVESALSFLGYGVRVPFASWGTLTSETRDLQSWWVPLFPGLALFATLLCVQLLGESLRRAVDPRAEVRP